MLNAGALRELQPPRATQLRTCAQDVNSLCLERGSLALSLSRTGSLCSPVGLGAPPTARDGQCGVARHPGKPAATRRSDSEENGQGDYAARAPRHSAAVPEDWGEPSVQM